MVALPTAVGTAIAVVEEYLPTAVGMKEDFFLLSLSGILKSTSRDVDLRAYDYCLNAK